ncbi:MAG: O-antigen polymerase [Thermosphaera sp.]
MLTIVHFFLCCRFYGHNFIMPYTLSDFFLMLNLILVLLSLVYGFGNVVTLDPFFKTCFLLVIGIVGSTVGLFINVRNGIFCKINKLLANFFHCQIRYKSYIRLCIYIIFFFLAFVTAFMIAISDDPFLWLTSPRQAYMTISNNLGMFWFFSTSLLKIMFILFLFSLALRRVKKKIVILFSSLPFIILAYFLGSKGLAVSFLIGSAIYWNYYVKRISLIEFLLFGAGIISFIWLLLILYHPLSWFKYFDYFYNTAVFMSHSEEIGKYYGRIFFEDVQYLVPRIFYPEKERVYGFNKYVYELLWPGVVSKGRTTPGFLGDVYTYVNFGFTGVFLYALISQVLNRLLFVFATTQDKKDFIPFLILMQINGFSIINLAAPFLPTLIIFIATFYLVIVFLKLTLHVFGVIFREKLLLKVSQ